MSGAILFKSGISWTAGSGAFDHVIALISAHFEDLEIDDHLRDALEFGHLSIEDLPHDLQDAIVRLLASEEMLLASSTTSKDETLKGPAAVELFDDLQSRAINDLAMPAWVTSDRDHVVVVGLTPAHITTETGLSADVVRREFPDLRFRFPHGVQVELTTGNIQRAEPGGSAAIIPTRIGQVVVTTSDDHPAEALERLAQLVAEALDRALEEET